LQSAAVLVRSEAGGYCCIVGLAQLAIGFWAAGSWKVSVVLLVSWVAGRGAAVRDRSDLVRPSLSGRSGAVPPPRRKDIAPPKSAGTNMSSNTLSHTQRRCRIRRQRAVPLRHHRHRTVARRHRRQNNLRWLRSTAKLIRLTPPVKFPRNQALLGGPDTRGAGSSKPQWTTS